MQTPKTESYEITKKNKELLVKDMVQIMLITSFISFVLGIIGGALVF